MDLAVNTGTPPVSYTIPFEQIALTCGDIESAMGYTVGSAPEPFPQMIEDGLSQASKVCTIKGGWLHLPISFYDESPEQVIVDSNAILTTGKVISSLLRDSTSAILFVCTAGEGISNKSKELFDEGDMVGGYIIDTIGSEIVERAMDIFQNKIEQLLATNNLKITNRYSPGYCGWSVADQHTFFSLFPDSFCGITLTHSALMQPTKSISGIIGVGERVVRGPYGCAICSSSLTCTRKKGRIQ